jgi:DNA-binding MarR family transcriptional regulator
VAASQTQVGEGAVEAELDQAIDVFEPVANRLRRGIHPGYYMLYNNYMSIDNYSPVEAVERALVTIRRRQTRRALARLAQAQPLPASFDVLDVLEAAEQADRPATVSSVADALTIDQPRASKLVAAAVAAGLVRREADQADGRRSFLVRTEAGRHACNRVHEFRRSVFAQAMAEWSDHERAEFARLLARFVDSLK